MIRVALLTLALAGCHRKPAWCAGDLSGTWRAESDARFRYKVTDDRKQVVFEPLYPVAGDYGPFRTVLLRKPDSLAGKTTSTFTQNGKTCPVAFASRIESCKGDKVELAGEMQFEIKIETCEVIASGVMTSATLVRETP